MTDKDKEIFYSTIGKNIRAARESRGIKQHVLALMLDLSRASVVNIEKGRQHVSLHTLWKISALLTTEFSEFMTGLGNPSSSKVEIGRMKFDSSFTSESEKQSAKREIEQFIETLKNS